MGSGFTVVQRVTKTVTKIPAALRGSVDTLANIATFVSEKGGFRQAVVFVVLSTVVKAVLDLIEAITGAALLPFNILGNVGDKVGADLDPVFGGVGTDIIDAINSVTAGIEQAALATGVFAPVIVILFWTLVAMSVFAGVNWASRRFLGVDLRGVIPG